MSAALIADLEGPGGLVGLARELWERLRAEGDAGHYGPGGEPLERLDPRQVERILAVVDNAPRFAFVARAVRRCGGVVVLATWELDRLAVALRPALARPGLAGRLAAWREGGLAQARSWGRSGPAGLALNRSIVRFADGFVLPDAALRERVLRERNAPTPTLVVDLGDAGRAAREIVASLARFPSHAARRPSLLGAAIAEADRARAARP